MSECLTCDAIEKSKRNKELQQLEIRISKEYANTNKQIKTIAIVETKNGIYGFREYGHESLARLTTIQYVFVIDGVVIG